MTTPRRTREHTPAELRDAFVARVNDIGKQDFPLWLSYLSLLVFLFVTVWTTTHAELLTNASKRLPVIGVELPLVGFFVLAPIVFVCVHAFMLITLNARRREIEQLLRNEPRLLCPAAWPEKRTQVSMLERIRDITARVAAERALRSACPETAGKERATLCAAGYWLQLARSTHPIGIVMFVLAPIGLLLFFLLAFLPYQSGWITAFHYLMVSIAIVASAALFGPLTARRRAWTLGGTALAMTAFASFATVRGSWLDFTGGVAFPSACPLLYDGTHSAADTPRPACYMFSRVLVLPDQDLIGDQRTRLDSPDAARTIVLRQRTLRGAILIATDLRKADLSETDLRGARFDGAWLHGGYLRDARLDAASFDGADLRGANLLNATLVGTSLRGANLTGADLSGAILPGADLSRTTLRAAWMVGTRLYGADLTSARLDGALLIDTHLQGAVLDKARLDGAYARDVRVRRGGLSPAQTGGLHLSGSLRHDIDAPPVEVGAGTWLAAATTWTRSLPAAATREAAPARLSRLHAVIAGSAGVAPEAGPRTAHRAAWARQLGEIACDAESRPHVARSIVQQIWERFGQETTAPNGRRAVRSLDDEEVTRIVRRLIGRDDSCYGIENLDAHSLERLRVIAARTPSSLAPNGNEARPDAIQDMTHPAVGDPFVPQEDEAPPARTAPRPQGQGQAAARMSR